MWQGPKRCLYKLRGVPRDTGSWVLHHKELNSARNPNEPGGGEEGKMRVQMARR